MVGTCFRYVDTSSELNHLDVGQVELGREVEQDVLPWLVVLPRQRNDKDNSDIDRDIKE